MSPWAARGAWVNGQAAGPMSTLRQPAALDRQGEMSLTEIIRIHLLAAGAVILLAGPSFAEKEAIGDQDLDRVSAAGICRTGSRPCDASEEDAGAAQTSGIAQDRKGLQVATTTTNTLDLSQAQQGMRTVILNNIVGPSQVANGINVSGGGPR